MTTEPELGVMESKSETAQMLEEVYNAMDGSEAAEAYAERHGIQSAAILTVFDDAHATLIAEHLRPRIEGKTVVEIGGGIGLLALHMGHVAKRVYCIEASPAWSWVFAQMLLEKKPRNVSFLFGAADEFLGAIKGDVAVFCTHSGVRSMSLVAAQFAPVVIDIWGEILSRTPEHFDPLARSLREIV